tara:strand:- start:2134 stop:2301 length:168 start_codon:yes stop_codon:yes gene_type:complete
MKSRIRRILMRYGASKNQIDKLLLNIDESDAKLIYILIQKIALRSAIKEMFKGSI